MFTGLIEGLGEVLAKRPMAKGTRLVLRAPFDLAETKLGDSMAVNGACLTVVEIKGDSFAVDVSPETLRRTTLGQLKVGEKVNLERALRWGDRLGGHLVSGHVDGVGEVVERKDQGDFIFFKIRIPKSLIRYVIEKGSIAIDGISLTINGLSETEIFLAIIPHTAAVTTIGLRRPGDRVNIEVDLIGKYVERLLGAYLPAQGQNASLGEEGVTLEFLREKGFL